MATQLEDHPTRNDSEISRIVQPFEQGPQPAFPNEARADARWRYPVTQLVAFHEELILPTKDMFEAVQCNDISRGGISFDYPGSPPTGYCTFILGRMPEVIFVQAKTAHFEPDVGPNQEWRIGCEFLRKTEPLF